MTVFYVSAIALIALFVVFLLWPILKSLFVNRRASSEYQQADREATNIALYKDHLADLEVSLAASSITAEEYQTLKYELERNLLADSETSQVEHSVQAKQAVKEKGAWLLGASMVLLAAAAVGIYTQIGAYQDWQIKSLYDERAELFKQQSILPESKEIAFRLEGVNRQLFSELEQHVARRPEDLRMRAALARLAMGSGKFPVAIQEFQAILAREPQSAQIMTELAQAIFAQSNNRSVPMVRSLAEKALGIEPNNTMALGLAGISAFQEERFAAAVTYWQKAVSLQVSTSPNARALQNGIVQAQARLAAQPQTQSQVGKPLEPAMAEPSDANPVVTLQVSLGDNVQFAPNDTVFVYARAWQGAKVPLAITRLKASQLPLTVTLTNAMSMAPGMNLNSAKKLELVARLSKSGQPIAQAGDWQASLGPVELSSSEDIAHTLTIAKPI